MVMRDSPVPWKCSVDQRVSSALRFASPHFSPVCSAAAFPEICDASRSAAPQNIIPVRSGDSTRSGITHKRMSATPRAVASPADAAASAAPAFGSVAGPLAESAPVAIYHTDAGGSITYANPAYRRMFGITAYQSLNDWPKLFIRRIAPNRAGMGGLLCGAAAREFRVSNSGRRRDTGLLRRK